MFDTDFIDGLLTNFVPLTKSLDPNLKLFFFVNCLELLDLSKFASSPSFASRALWPPWSSPTLAERLWNIFTLAGGVRVLSQCNSVGHITKQLFLDFLKSVFCSVDNSKLLESCFPLGSCRWLTPQKQCASEHAYTDVTRKRKTLPRCDRQLCNLSEARGAFCYYSKLFASRYTKSLKYKIIKI